MKSGRYFYITIFLFFLLFAEACNQGPPLKEVDCPKKNLDIKAVTGYTGGVIKRDIEVVLGIDLKCGGSPVPDAEVLVEYWWKDSVFKHSTDGSGHLQVERSVMIDPRGETVKVVVRGSNGKKALKLKIEKNWDDIMRSASDKMK
ncbi:MAG: hypothetical protein HY809_08485 [Nitrospirae bacterium]|nr:hypothetical protein [Nitrospirota bacterium]